MRQKERFQQARKAVQRAALNRYLSRIAERDRNKALISAAGPGAADSDDRRRDFRDRVLAINMLRNIQPGLRLPFGIERKMGASLDFRDTAPDAAAKQAGRSVARIVVQRGAGLEPEGLATGFLVAPDLLITNWHVFPSRADADGCAANFLYERTESGISRGATFEFDPARFFFSDERLDFAIVAVSPHSVDGIDLETMGQNTLIEATPKILKGHPVNIIQHPEGRPKQYAVAQNRLVDILPEGFLQYETDTLEGSSGSPAFSERWELVALHHASIPQLRDGKVVALDGSEWVEGMGDERVRWIANEGVRVSAIVEHLRMSKPDDPGERAILDELLASTGDPVAEGMRAISERERVERGTSIASRMSGGSSETQETLQGGDMAAINFTFTGPVTINVAADSPAFSQVKVSADSATFAPEKSIRFDPEYDLRGGYKQDFLDPTGKLVVPPPKVAESRLGEMLVGDDGNPLVLKYHHFELAMNKVRRLQMWSAANVDYDPRRKTRRKREEWGRDRWIPDPRIPAIHQIFDADFYKPAGNIDRGHIVRREDNEWGDSETEIEFANSDTFHWTNCTPQHEAFNQSDPGRNDKAYKGMEGVWGAFENHIQQSRRGNDTKACLLAGPILAEGDPEKDFGRGNVRYPLRFWKVVCVVEPGPEGLELRAFGFILNQKPVVDRFGIEKFGPGRFKRYQVPLAEIASEAGIVFDEELLRADAHAGQSPRELVSATEIGGIG